jgi:hypothetical protein
MLERFTVPILNFDGSLLSALGHSISSFQQNIAGVVCELAYEAAAWVVQGCGRGFRLGHSFD